MSEEIEHYTDDNAATEGPAMQENGILKYDFCKNIENLINIYKILFESMVMEYSPSNITARLNEIMVELCAWASAAGAAQESAAALEVNFHMVLENVKIFINHFSAINTNNFVYIKTYIQKYKEHPLTIIDLYKKKTERDYETILNEGNANKYIKWLIK